MGSPKAVKSMFAAAVLLAGCGSLRADAQTIAGLSAATLPKPDASRSMASALARRGSRAR
jgi:hypothetical protein